MTVTDLVGLKDDTFQVHLRSITARIVLVLAGRFHYRIDVITIGTLAACRETMQPIVPWYCMLVNDLELQSAVDALFGRELSTNRIVLNENIAE